MRPPARKRLLGQGKPGLPAARGRLAGNYPNPHPLESSSTTATEEADQPSSIARSVSAYLPWKANVSHIERALDTLAIDAGAGDDTLDTSDFAPETIQLEVH